LCDGVPAKLGVEGPDEMRHLHARCRHDDASRPRQLEFRQPRCELVFAAAAELDAIKSPAQSYFELVFKAIAGNMLFLDCD
jgi:hypothetical protein